MKFDTIKDAATSWVESFNAIPQSVVSKLMEFDESIHEITPPSVGDRVYIFDGKWSGNYGTICKSNYRGNENFLIDIDGEEQKRIVPENYISVERDSFLPMWGTMWTFSDSCDEEWANGEYLGPHLQEMADCGFRIYESEDFGIIFGIDGCGYDFYSSHWCPLYIARGLKWHKEEASNGKNKRSDRKEILTT